MNKGFTLLETLLYIAIASAVVGAIAGILHFIVDGRLRYAAVSESVSQASWASQRFVSLVQSSHGITEPGQDSSGGTLVLEDGTTITASGTVMVLILPSSTPRPLTGRDTRVASLSFERSASGSAELVRMSFHILPASGQFSIPGLEYDHTYVTSAAPLQ